MSDNATTFASLSLYALLSEFVFDKMGWEAIADLPGEASPSRRRKRG